MTECSNNMLIITVLHLGAVNKRLISFENPPILYSFKLQGFFKIVLVSHLSHMKHFALKTDYSLLGIRGEFHSRVLNRYT